MSEIYLLRHGQSEGNLDPSLYATKKNREMSITKQGHLQATQAAKQIRATASPFDSVSMFASPYVRTQQTAKTIQEEAFSEHSIQTDFLLGERCQGEQEGCSVIDNFDSRPVERHIYDTLGHIEYRPGRGESLMDVYVRATLFVLKYNSFQFTPLVVIISHRDFCFMLHAFLTGEMPTPESSWGNCEIRRYKKKALPADYEYLGIINDL